MDSIVVPSIIAESQGELDGMLDRIRGKAHRVMLDIMDGDFVENRSLDFDFSIPEDEFKFEAHLMTTRPLEWLEKHGHKVQIVIFQIETLDDIEKTIGEARERGLKVYLALNPETGLETVLDHLDAIDGIVIMTVNPGSFCIEFIPETLEKVKKLRQIRGSIPIEVDGCMNPDHIRIARDAGANIFDSGSYVMKSEDVDEALAELQEAAR
jgi:ribulose-phosphate 3-epimerase